MKTKWTFTIWDRLVGHKCSVAAAHGDAYTGFKRTVRVLANLAGVPDTLERGSVYRVDTVINFRIVAHTDAENVRKAIIDGLWEQDRRVLHGSYDAYENIGRDSARVLIERIR